MISTALLLLASLAPQSDPWTSLEGTTPAQWRLVWKDAPQHKVTVSWSTREAGTEHIVHYDTISRAGTDVPYANTQAAQRNGAYTLQKDEVGVLRGASYHHARIDGLEPSTTYWFQLESDGVRSPEMHFITAPVDDRAFKMIHGGDSRSGHAARQEINAYIGLLIDEEPELITFAHGGDYILWGELWAHWRPWLSHHELTTSPTGRVLPVIPTRGNHEPGPIFDEVFDDPGGAGLNYYTTDITPEISLITLNSEISAAGDQATFLEAELKRLRPKRTWLMTQYHRAIYPAVKDPAAMKPHWVPLFEQYDLDLALESDGHAVKRTVPIRDEKRDPTGVVYIGEGGLGVPQRDPSTDRWFLQEPGMVGKSHHIVMLEFTKGALKSKIIGLPEPKESAFTPAAHIQVVADGATWRYLRGADPADQTWRGLGFDDSSWESGVSGFGYGDDDDATVLEDMQGNYQRLYIRTPFEMAKLAELDAVQLAVRYDDAFIAYINGVEVTRSSVNSGSGPDAKEVDSHEAKGWELFPLGTGAELAERFGAGTAVLAVEGHNSTLKSSDFSLWPCLIGPSLEEEPGLEAAVLLDELTLIPRSAR